MIDFIVSNWDSVLVIILFTVGILFMIKKGATRQVNEILFYLATEAEREFGNGTGALKYAAVTTWLYERLPSVIKILFTDKQIDQMIENAVDDMKDYLDTNSKAKLLIVD